MDGGSKRFAPAQVPVDFDREEGFRITPRKPVPHRPITSTAQLLRMARSIKHRRTYKPLQIRKSWQRCMVKIKYTRRSTKGSWVARAKYLTTTKEPDLAEVQAFDKYTPATTANSDVQAAVERWYEAGDKRMFRIIISPESHAADLEKLTRATMDAAGKELGRDLEWKAAIHHDEKTPHVHVLLRGAANGGALILPREFVCGGMRRIARDQLTQQLGHRLHHALEPARALQPERQRETGQGI
jgi:type IV secretory pathway VirD2 relaxase